MKETLLKIPIFSAAFVLLYLGAFLLYSLYVWVLPGGEGLVFTSALSLGLLPALALGLVVTLNSLHHHPGIPLLSVFVAVLCFFAGLHLAFFFREAISPVPPVERSLAVGRVYADGTSMVYSGDRSENRETRLFNPVVRKSPDSPLVHYPWADFDKAHGKLIFPDGSPSLAPPKDAQELAYFSPPAVLRGIFADINFVHRYLEGAYAGDWNRFFLLSLILSSLVAGLMVFMHIKVWPLIKWSLLLIGLRFLFFFLRFCFHDAVYIASRWTTDSFFLEGLPLAMASLGGLFLLNIALFRLPFKRGGE